MSHQRFCLLVFLVALIGQQAIGQVESKTPLEQSGFSRVTSYDSLDSFVRSLATMPNMQVSEIATTRQGRHLFAVVVSSARAAGTDTAKVRVLLFAQQHGDEPSGKEALTLLLARCASGTMAEVLQHLDLVIVPQMNPDGAESGRRRTADTIDLNRNHVLLTSPETRALHDLFARWLPHVTLDVHEYGSFSSSWSDSGFIKTADVQIGMLTNLNTPADIHTIQHSRMFPFILGKMEAMGYSCQEYIVGSPGERIRHSTTEINDGRQSFGILNTVSFIQEGRKWKGLEDHLERRARSQLSAIVALLEFCSQHAAELRGVVDLERFRLSRGATMEAVVRMDHAPGGNRMTIPVQVVSSGKAASWTIPLYHGTVLPLLTVKLPSAYVVPRECDGLVALLVRHHVQMQRLPSERSVTAWRYLIDSSAYEVREEDSIRSVIGATQETLQVVLRPGDFVVETAQLHRMFLAALLEPQSMWGVRKYSEFDDLFRERRYPILRLP